MKASSAFGWVNVLVGLLLTASLPAPIARADPADAVVRIPSHGCSGTVIATGPGETWIITCAHGWEGRDASKPLAVDAPWPAAGQQRDSGTGVRVVKLDHEADLCLIRLPRGPLPYFAPVGEIEPRPGQTVYAVGHAAMRWPANRAAYTVVDLDGQWTHTRQRPAPGDSGGPLLDASGNLVGTCTGFEGGRGGRGMYVRLLLIRRFLGFAPGSDFSLPGARPAPFARPSPFG
jgi:hypothetical protein